MSDFQLFKEKTASRLREFIHTNKMSQVEFADFIDVKRPSLAAVLSKGALSAQLVYKITDKYPRLNWNWMYKGNGEIIESTPAVYIDGYNVLGNAQEKIQEYVESNTNVDKLALLELENKHLKEQIKTKDELIELFKKMLE